MKTKYLIDGLLLIALLISMNLCNDMVGRSKKTQELNDRMIEFKDVQKDYLDSLLMHKRDSLEQIKSDLDSVLLLKTISK